MVASLLSGAASAGPERPEAVGSFSEPFVEPTIGADRTEEECVEHDGHEECKPAAGTMSVLADGRILYFNALEGTENIQQSTGGEFGHVSVNDQTRILDLSGPRWSEPSPVDGGANPDGYEEEELLPGSASQETHNDGALFCADVVTLSDGRVLAIGGTAYYDEGIAELEGLKNARIFDPEGDRWSQTGSMRWGRWYPSGVTLANGNVFVASGVTKLIKPLYREHPQDSGRNVVQTETFDVADGKWLYNGASADRSLPLYPRLHLLPNGSIYYNASGQVFNPMGQSYDEFGWNIAAAYDPEQKTWTDLGIPGIGTSAPGFRGSTFSVMLTLRPEDGEYTKAEFLTGGGVLGTTPGAYIATNASTVTTVDTEADMSVSTRETAPLNEPRWYGTAVLLPTGEVAAFSGANRDEVVGPGTGQAVARAEMFDPESETWRPLSTAHHQRTYHNTAALLPDGRVLVGGHAPIPTLYGAHQTLPGFSPNEGRDPTFEVYSPPYLFWDERPKILQAEDDLSYGRWTTIVTDVPAERIESVVLVRYPSITHLVDGDQRSVELPVLARHGKSVTVSAPPSGDVAPPGPYMLFVNLRSERGLIPSVSVPVLVD